MFTCDWTAGVPLHLTAAGPSRVLMSRLSKVLLPVTICFQTVEGRELNLVEHLTKYSL